MDQKECPKCKKMTAEVKYWPSKFGGVWATRCPCGYSHDSVSMPDWYHTNRQVIDHKEEDRQHDLGN